MAQTIQRKDTSHEEKTILGVMLLKNDSIEEIVPKISAEEFIGHKGLTALLFDLICRVRGGIEKRAVYTDYFRTKPSLFESPDDQNRICALATECEAIARNFVGSVNRVIEAIHHARRIDQMSAIRAELDKFLDPSIEQMETVHALALKFTDLAKSGILRPRFEKIAKVQFSEPVYKLTVQMKDRTAELELSAEALEKVGALRLEIFKHFDYFPDYLPSANQWRYLVNALMAKAEIHAVDQENPDKLVNVERRDLFEAFQQYLKICPRTEKLEELQPRMIWENREKGLIGISYTDLTAYLSPKVSKLSRRELQKMLSEQGYAYKQKGVDRKWLWVKLVGQSYFAHDEVAL